MGITVYVEYSGDRLIGAIDGANKAFTLSRSARSGSVIAFINRLFVESAVSAGTGTYTKQTGRYVRQGNLVTVFIELTWTAHDGTGRMLIPLPYAAGEFYTPAVVIIDSIPMTAGYIYSAAVYGPWLLMYVQDLATGNRGPLDVDAAGTIQATAVYLTIE